MNTLIITMTAQADEINALHAQAIGHASKAIDYARQAGKLLLQVKGELQHGEFTAWLELNCSVTPRQAQRYMRAALGKPMPIRAITKNDTVSDLLINDGEGITIAVEFQGWRETIFVYPSAEHPGFYFYGCLAVDLPTRDNNGGSLQYGKRPILGSYLPLVLDNLLKDWRTGVLERWPCDGVESNPFALQETVGAA